MKTFFKSKRAFLTIIVLIIWLLCVLIFKKNAIEIASSLAMISGIYLGFETLKPSKTE